MTTDVVPLGTASALPAEGRHLSAVALERKGRVLLFDCGEGTQFRLLHAGLKRTRVDAVFITHLHGDHCYGLPGLLETMALQQRAEPITLVLPAGGGGHAGQSRWPRSVSGVGCGTGSTGRRRA